MDLWLLGYLKLGIVCCSAVQGRLNVERVTNVAYLESWSQVSFGLDDIGLTTAFHMSFFKFHR